MANPFLDNMQMSQPKQSANNAGITAEDPSNDTEALLMEAIGTYNKTVAEAKAKSKIMVEQMGSSTSDIVEAIEQQTAANTISKRAELNAEFQKQQSDQKLLKAAADSQTQVEMITELTEQSKKKDSALDAYEAQRAEKHTGIGIVDGVLNAFMNLKNVRDFKVADRREEEAAESIARVTGAQAQFSNVNELTKQSLTEGAMAANLDALKAESIIAANNAKIEALKLNSEAMNTLMVADSRTLDAISKKFDVEDRVEARKLQREQMEFTRLEMANRMKQWEEQREARSVALSRDKLGLKSDTKRFEDLVALEDQLVTATNMGQAVLGMPVEERETVVWAMGEPGPTGERYKKLREVGVSKTLGSSPSEAINTISTVAPEGNFERTKYTELLSNLEQQYTGALTATNAPKTAEQRDAQLDNFADVQMATFASNINSVDNPYHAPPLESLAPALQTNPLYAKVLAKIPEAEGVKQLNGETIAKLAADAVLAKTLGVEEAAESLHSIYKLAKAYNNTIAGGFERVGLDPQRSYNVSIDVGPNLLDVAQTGLMVAAVGTFASMDRMTKTRRETFNLADPVETRALMAKLLSRKTKNAAPNTVNEGTR